MRQTNRLVAAAGILAVVTAGHADTIVRQRVFDLTKVSDPSVFTLYKTQVNSIGMDDENLTQARLTFPDHYASIGRKTTWSEDWSPYNILTVKLTNHESFPCEFRGLVYLGSSEANTTGMFSGRIVIGANETRRFVLYLNPDDSAPYGLKYNRPVLTAPYNSVYCSGGFRDLRTIYSWRISYQGYTPARVDVSDLRLLKQDLNYTGMVDAFGQYTDRDWPTKVRSTDDLQGHLADEKADLAANPNPGEQQGTTQIPNDHPVPGQWAIVTENNGMKFVQHPNGKLLWTLGVSAIGMGSPTPVGGRETYFESLPDPNGTFGSCYIVRPTLDGNNNCYWFQQQNLMLKYGANYATPWLSMVKQRLGSWGLNTLGMQCDGRVVDGSMPYTIILSTSGFGTRLRLPHQIWGTMPDPFDSGFTSWMTTNFSSALSAYNGQTNFMGAYVDNELSWGYIKDDKSRYNIELGLLKAPSTQPAKVAFVNWLSSRYGGSISALNTSWGTTYSSFSGLLSSTWVPGTFPLPTGMAADFQGFTSVFAKKYFSTVRSALNAVNLSGLYLGCRYAEYLPEVIEQAEPYVDVHTFNAYRTADNFDWAYAAGLSKPYMFSEMGYSVQADGTFGGVGEVYSQADRSKNLRDFLQTANGEPNCVGAILYCYTDQPITGRYSDYENSGLGLVDITDTPHYEAINVLRDVSRNMYTNRAAGETTVNPPLNPDFGLSATQASQSVVQGGLTTYAFSTNSVDGYSGSVSFSVSGLPSGVTASFSPASLTAGAGTTMAVNTSTSTPTGTFTLTVKATDGSLSHSTSVTLQVNRLLSPDFSLIANVPSRSITQGNATSYGFTTGTVDGYSGTLTFSVSGLPSGATASFSPSSASAGSSTTLNVGTTSSTPTGTYTLTVKATDGSTSHTATVSLSVTAQLNPDFNLTAAQNSGSVVQGSGVSFGLNSSTVDGYTGTLTLSVSGLPSGATASFSPSSLSAGSGTTLNVSTTTSTPVGTYNLTVQATDGTKSHSVALTLTVSALATVAPGDFSLSASPSSWTIRRGTSCNYKVTVTGLNGFVGSVSLSATGTGTGTSLTFSPVSITGSGTSNVKIVTSNATPKGTYTLTFKGTSGSVVHSTSVRLVVK